MLAMRYCDWSDDEREDFIWKLFKRQTRTVEIAHKKMQNHIRSNNKETKNSGYKSFANHIGG